MSGEFPQVATEEIQGLALQEEVAELAVVEEQGLLSRIGERFAQVRANVGESARQFVGEHPAARKIVAAGAAASLAVAGAVELGANDTEPAQAASGNAKAMTFNRCAQLATHPNKNNYKSEFFTKNFGDPVDRFVHISGQASNLSGCDGIFSWKAQIRKENKHGYYNATGKVPLANSSNPEFAKDVKTKGRLSCDGDAGAGDGTYDAYQKNYITYKSSTGAVEKRNFKSPIKAATRYC